MKTTIDYTTEPASIPSPTGYTSHVMNYVIAELGSLGCVPAHTNRGGAMVTITGKNDSKHRVVTAHLDILGVMVRAVKPDGCLKMDLVGDLIYNAIEGEGCTVHVSKNGKKISGIILMYQTPVYVYKDTSTARRNQTNMKVRLDEKVTNGKEACALGIEVGDFISLDLRVAIAESGFIKSRHLDDKVSTAILIELLKGYKAQNITLPYTTHFYFPAFKELGCGASSSIPVGTVEHLPVDMEAMGNDQQTGEYSVPICVRDDSGPCHYESCQHFVKLANDNKIFYRLNIYPYYGSDASAAPRIDAEVKHALFGTDIKSGHPYERTRTGSVQATKCFVNVYLRSPIMK